MTVLEHEDVSFEIIAVSDGSTDGSGNRIADLVGDTLCIESLPCNSGKGNALHVGLAAGRGRYIGFIDADGDLDPQLLSPFLALARVYQPDIILGSKRHPMSEVDYTPIRRMYSVTYQILTTLLFRLTVRDTQTGLKLVRREVLAAALPRMVEKGPRSISSCSSSPDGSDTGGCSKLRFASLSASRAPSLRPRCGTSFSIRRPSSIAPTCCTTTTAQSRRRVSRFDRRRPRTCASGGRTPMKMNWSLPSASAAAGRHLTWAHAHSHPELEGHSPSRRGGSRGLRARDRAPLGGRRERGSVGGQSTRWPAGRGDCRCC